MQNIKAEVWYSEKRKNFFLVYIQSNTTFWYSQIFKRVSDKVMNKAINGCKWKLN